MNETEYTLLILYTTGIPLGAILYGFLATRNNYHSDDTFDFLFVTIGWPLVLGCFFLRLLAKIGEGVANLWETR